MRLGVINATHLPLLDGSTSQETPASAQLVHGCTSITSHRTRRELQTVQACFARDFLADEATEPFTDGEGDVISASFTVIRDCVLWLLRLKFYAYDETFCASVLLC